MRAYLFTLILAIPMLGYSITGEITTSDITRDGDEPKMTGYTDAKGKQGYWIIYAKDRPELTDYAPDGKIEQGAYKDDRKIGEWIFYHYDGVTAKTKGNFVDGRPNGAYVKINEKGVTIQESNYNNGKQSGIFITYDDEGNKAIEKNFNTDGKEDGPATYYYPDGTVQYSYTKVNGVLTGEAIRYWEDGSVKEIKVYNSAGEIVSTTVVNPDPPVAPVVVNGSGGPNGSSGITKDGKEFLCNGYNKVYNQADEIWMDGTFKGCELWEGKLYQYDKDGILLKFEVWKDGAYHSDGQLKK